ncbi:MAG: hypothetical protein PHU86_01405 [Patescibacteria group bacterium]|nr:hypothetical protein [Patescibacteria group bacterium]
MFSEGKRDKKFLYVLTELPKFKYHTAKWSTPNLENASGEAPKVILDQCQRATLGKDYDLVMAFIDLDVLKNNYPRVWKVEKQKLETKYPNIKIIWQIDNAEQEYKRVLGDIDPCSKHRLNQVARDNVKAFINSDLWHRILQPIRNVEETIDRISHNDD